MTFLTLKPLLPHDEDPTWAKTVAQLTKKAKETVSAKDDIAQHLKKMGFKDTPIDQEIQANLDSTTADIPLQTQPKASSQKKSALGWLKSKWTAVCLGLAALAGTIALTFNFNTATQQNDPDIAQPKNAPVAAETQAINQADTTIDEETNLPIRTDIVTTPRTEAYFDTVPSKFHILGVSEPKTTPKTQGTDEDTDTPDIKTILDNLPERISKNPRYSDAIQILLNEGSSKKAIAQALKDLSFAYSIIGQRDMQINLLNAASYFDPDNLQVQTDRHIISLEILFEDIESKKIIAEKTQKQFEKSLEALAAIDTQGAQEFSKDIKDNAGYFKSKYGLFVPENQQPHPQPPQP